MAVRTKALFRGDVSASAAPGVTFYEAPAGETAIVKYIVVRFASAATCTLRAGVTGTLVPFFEHAGAAGEIVRLETYIVLQPGDVLTAVTGGVSVRLHVSGTELEGVAD